MLSLRSRVALGAIPVAFAAMFFAYPLGAIVHRGLRPGGDWDLAAFGEVLSDLGTWKVGWFTLWQAVVSTLLTIAVVLPGAWCFARLDFPCKRLAWALLVVPFVLPTVVVGSAFLALLGPGGPLGIDLRSTIWAILIAHVFFNYAIVVRTVGARWSNLDTGLADSARTLGASRWRVATTVVWPELRSSVFAAGSIVFLFTFTSFGVVLLLGGASQRTLDVEIYTQTARLLNLDKAAVLALLQLVGVVTVLLIYARVQRRHATTWSARPARTMPLRSAGSPAQVVFVVNVVFGLVLLGVPLLLLVERSIDTPHGWGFDHYGALDESKRGSTLFVSPMEAVWNSLLFASATAVLAAVVGGLASAAIALRGRGAGIGRWMDLTLMIPLGTSAVTVGFGFLVAFGTPPLDLRDSVALIPIAHAVVAVPFVIRTMVPALRSIDPRLRESVSVLGAAPWRSFRTIDLAMVRRAAVVGLAFAFAVSLGEFGATIFLARADRPTIPVAIYRFLGRPDPASFGQAMALATILMTVTALVVLGVDRLRTPGQAEF